MNRITCSKLLWIGFHLNKNTPGIMQVVIHGVTGLLLPLGCRGLDPPLPPPLSWPEPVRSLGDEGRCWSDDNDCFDACSLDLDFVIGTRTCAGAGGG